MAIECIYERYMDFFFTFFASVLISLYDRVNDAIKQEQNLRWLTHHTMLNRACVVPEQILIWALSRENLSSGLPTKRESSQSPQLLRLARELKFHM